MQFPVLFFYILNVYVRVDLGGVQAFVAEHFLQASQVRSALEQVRGEGVSEKVGIYPSCYTGRFSQGVDVFPNRYSAYLFAVFV